MEESEKPSFWEYLLKWLRWIIIIAMFLLGIGITYIIYYNRYIPATPAQIQQVQNDLGTIAQAFKQVKADTGYYVTLEALADPPGYGLNTSSTYSPFTQYNIQSEPIPFVIDSTGKLSANIQFPYNKWNGPYIDFQNKWEGSEYTFPIKGIFQGPADPWWTIYRFYTPQGLIKPEPRDPKYSPFTTYTLVSYGPDKEPGYNGSTVGTGDDFV